MGRTVKVAEEFYKHHVKTMQGSICILRRLGKNTKFRCFFGVPLSSRPRFCAKKPACHARNSQQTNAIFERRIILDGVQAAARLAESAMGRKSVDAKMRTIVKLNLERRTNWVSLFFLWDAVICTMQLASF